MHTKNEALNYAIENSIIDYEAILHEMDMAERKGFCQCIRTKYGKEGSEVQFHEISDCQQHPRARNFGKIKNYQKINFGWPLTRFLPVYVTSRRKGSANPHKIGFSVELRGSNASSNPVNHINTAFFDAHSGALWCLEHQNKENLIS